MKNASKTPSALPSDEAILGNKMALRDFAQKVASGEIKLRQKATLADKLHLISDELRLMEGVPYGTLRAILKDHVGLVVGEDTLRQYCQNELGFAKKPNVKFNKTLSN